MNMIRTKSVLLFLVLNMLTAALLPARGLPQESKKADSPRKKKASKKKKGDRPGSEGGKETKK